MRLIIQPTYKMVSKWAANYIINKINSFHPGHKKRFVLGLPTGSSPIGMYKSLIKQYTKGIISFKYVTTFNMDNYVGISENHPQSYHSFMLNNFFNHMTFLKWLKALTFLLC